MELTKEELKLLKDVAKALKECKKQIQISVGSTYTDTVLKKYHESKEAISLYTKYLKNTTLVVGYGDLGAMNIIYKYSGIIFNCVAIHNDGYNSIRFNIIEKIDLK